LDTLSFFFLSVYNRKSDSDPAKISWALDSDLLATSSLSSDRSERDDEIKLDPIVSRLGR